METITLDRTADLPVTFDGECLAKSTSHRHDGPGNNRWHDMTLYRTRSGAYVVSVTYRSNWQGEDDDQRVYHADTPAAVRDRIRDVPLTPQGVGYPSGGAYAEKQARMEADLRRRFGVAVTELFRGLDGFTEPLGGARAMTPPEIETLADGVEGMTDDEAAEAVKSCGDAEVIEAVKAAEQASGSDETPTTLYPRVLRAFAAGRGE